MNGIFFGVIFGIIFGIIWGFGYWVGAMDTLKKIENKLFEEKE